MAALVEEGRRAEETTKSTCDHKHGDECCSGGHGKNGHAMPTIFDAIKSGMLVPVQTIIEAMGVDVVKSRDEKGHTPAHWACLGGHTTILRYLIEMKAPVDEPSDNELGQRPIHWACVNGHIAVVDVLLQTGVNIDVTDNKGCSPLIVSCQYGKTMLAAYLMGKGARLQLVDKDGDTALHWAAFKGHNELMRLLIYSGFNPHQRDNYGQTPLHLASISGNLTAVTELCEQDSVDFDIADKNGKTPLMLAVGRKHDKIIHFLKKHAKQRSSLLPKIDIWAIVFGPPGNTKGPLLFFVVSMLFWGYPMYVFRALPVSWNELHMLHLIFMAVNVVMWISLYHAATADPGFLPRNIPEYDRAMKEVAHYDEWKQGVNPLSRLCHTCRTVKPLRSKHCRICNRCVTQFDHHCPYIYNCVGIRNRVWFFGFLACMEVNGTLSVYFCLYVLRVAGWSWLVSFGLAEVAFFSVIVTFVLCFTRSFCRLSFFVFTLAVCASGSLTWLLSSYFWYNYDYNSLVYCVMYILSGLEGVFFQSIASLVAVFSIYHAAVNLTTNERINKKRYEYLKDGKGKFYNPYDKGIKNNVMEFFHLQKPPGEDEINLLNVQII